MVFLPAQRKLKLFLLFCLLFTIFIRFATPIAYAQAEPTPTVPSGDNPNWEFSAEVTEVGKNAERARELLWWVWTHPPLYNNPVLAQTWFASVKIAMIFLVFIIVAFGLGVILTRGKGTVGPIFSGISSPFGGANMQSIFMRIIMILIYVACSYFLVLGIIQVAEISMNIIRSVAGGDLFNVIFSGTGNVEDNYINFIGFKDSNPVNLEMVNTSLSLIRLTTLTYNIMSILLILRAVILWFMLILAPFLVFLMPFIFIRNTGWIWIGVFFQWVFYGPLMTLFLVTTVQIWVNGIPYAFKFGRTDKPEGQVYKTAINILYGGPAQIISPGNSANYVDTYAEYVISLIMLWASIILPWLLLRIFRDYCCGAIASGNATLTAIFDRFRQYPPPTPPAPAPTKATISVELPFRETVKEKIKEIEKTRIEQITTKEIHEVKTEDLAQAMKLAVGSLADVSNLEMNKTRRMELKRNLDKISAPESIASSNERQKFESLKSELQSRAAVGDKVAAAILVASENKKEGVVSQLGMMTGMRPSSTPVQARGAFAPTAAVTTPVIRPVTAPVVQQNIVQNVARQTSESEEVVKNILQSITNTDISHLKLVTTLAQETGLAEVKVQNIVDAASSVITSDMEMMKNISSKSEVSVEKLKEVFSSIQTMGIQSSEIIGTIAKKTNLNENKIHEIMKVVSATIATKPEMVENIAKKASTTSEKVYDVLTNLSSSDITGAEVISALAKKLGITEAKVQEIITIARSSAGTVSAPSVSVEDYEEVKTMWLKHFRSAPVPETEKIKTRTQWLAEEEKKLNNVANLLSSSDVKLKQKGLEQVAEILPFMLLGGFSQNEIMTYIKAKVEAAKQVNQELELIEKARAEEKAKAQDEENLVDISTKAETSAEATMQTEQKMEMPLEDKKGETPKEDK